MDWLPIWLIGAALGAVVGGLLGKAKGKQGEGLVLGFLLGPIGWLLISVDYDSRPKCPFCRSSVDPAATVCAHCQRDIPSTINTVCRCGRRFRVPDPKLGHAVKCPTCHAITKAGNLASPNPQPVTKTT